MFKELERSSFIAGFWCGISTACALIAAAIIASHYIHG